MGLLRSKWPAPSLERMVLLLSLLRTITHQALLPLVLVPLLSLPSQVSLAFIKEKRLSRPIAFGSKVPLDSINQTISVRPPDQSMLPLVKAADYVPNHKI